jgi:two-component system phosphate regulon response regulator PhoB
VNKRIVIVEDEPAISELVAVNLRHAGYAIEQAGDATQAMSLIQAQQTDLLVLDWMLPGTSGIELAKRLRATEAYRLMPILMLTARAQEGDKLQGFEVGVDDYLTKPFSPRELVARVSAVLRRTQSIGAEGTPSEPIQIGPLRLDPQTYRAHANDSLLELSPTEFKLLSHFMSNPEWVMSRGKLLDAVWDDADIDERTVDVHIRRLRLALKPHNCDQFIQTVRGGGYRLSLK